MDRGNAADDLCAYRERRNGEIAPVPWGRAKCEGEPGGAGVDSVSIIFRPFHELPPNMPKLVKELLARGANPNAQIAKDFPPYSRSPYALQMSLAGVTPFLLAAAAADVDLMRALLRGG